MNDPKLETIAAYDALAETLDADYAAHLERYNLAHADAFMAALRGPSILDLGCGPGNHAERFRDWGFDPLCADLSPAMLAVCRRKGLRAVQVDLESFELTERFDGIWANACLLHLARDGVPAALERIARHLKPGGTLGCAVKEGEGESVEERDGTRRHFTWFGEAEFRALLEPRFEAFRFERTVTRSRGTAFIKFLARRRP